MELEASHLMLLAGIVLGAWFLIRLQVKRQQSGKKSNRALKSIQEDTSTRGIPLADAPRNLQRWQAEMFSIQRELTAELETKAAVVNRLLLEAETTIERLNSAMAGSSTTAKQPPPPGRLTARQAEIKELFATGLSAGEIAARLGMTRDEVVTTIELVLPLAER